MKLVKLDRRYKAHKEYGHTWAFRWPSYDPSACHQVEKIMQDLHGSQYAYGHNRTDEWRSGFGHASRRNLLLSNGRRPYWISFRNEQDATVILLKLENSNV